MTPTRSELIEKARAKLGDLAPHAIASFCLPLLAAARREALEEAKGVLRHWYTSGRWTLSELIAGVDALARETDKPEADRGRPTAQSGGGSIPPPPPALSDASILERAAEILEREQGYGAGVVCADLADRLRARSASPEPDWADAIEKLAWSSMSSKHGLANLLRERFGECVALLSQNERQITRVEAKRALARLRGEKEKA